MAAHLLVGGILGMAADIARTNALHSVHLTQHILHAPETTAGENSRSVCTDFGGSADEVFSGFSAEAAAGSATGMVGMAARYEIEGEGIHAMARIFSGKSFVRKDVAQMGSALGAENLRTASVGIRFAAHGTRNFIIEAGPAAAGIEFILRTVQRSTAPAAAVGAVFVVEVIFTGKGSFGSFSNDHPLFFGSQWFHILCI